MFESIDELDVVLAFFALFILIFPAVWGYKAGAKRVTGPIGGMLLGLFLNLAGVLIVYCTNRRKPKNFYNFLDQREVDQLLKYKKLLKTGVISRTEYDIAKSSILNPKPEIVSVRR